MREMTAEQERKRRERATQFVTGVVSKLSPMQREFLVEYLVSSNATEAAEKSGYSNPNSQGSRLLTYDKIQAAISDYFFGPEMEAAEVVKRLAQQGRAEYADYLTVEGSVDLGRMKADDMMHLIKGFKHTQYGLNVEFFDAQSALVHVGRYHGLFTDRTDLTSGGEALQPPTYIVENRPNDS